MRRSRLPLAPFPRKALRRTFSRRPTNPLRDRAPDRVQALVDVAVSYLETLPGEPADDHTVVMVHVNAEALDVLAGTPRVAPEDVPARTSIEAGTCFVEATARSSLRPPNGCCARRRCRALLGRGGKVLSLGRTKRLATRAQRRALKVRDKGICQFPGCHATSHLDAHHTHPTLRSEEPAWVCCCGWQMSRPSRNGVTYMSLIVCESTPSPVRSTSSPAHASDPCTPVRGLGCGVRS